MSVTRSPTSRRLSTSRPRVSVPSTCDQLGSWLAANRLPASCELTDGIAIGAMTATPIRTDKVGAADDGDRAPQQPPQEVRIPPRTPGRVGTGVTALTGASPVG